MYAARNIRVKAGGKLIVDDASIALAPGKVVAIVGPNGAGKSTLLKVLAGERRPNEGVVTLDDVALRQWDAYALAKRRAVLPQSVTVAFPFLAEEIVALGVPQYYPRGEGQELTARALAEVDMSFAAAQTYDTLSGASVSACSWPACWCNSGRTAARAICFWTSRPRASTCRISWRHCASRASTQTQAAASSPCFTISISRSWWPTKSLRSKTAA